MAETKSSTPFQFSYAPSVLYVPHGKFTKHFSGTTGSTSVQYRWIPLAMAYVSWARGFKSGGFNSRFNGVVAGNAPPSFDRETADAREIGIKLDFERLRVNVALFTTAYDDLQFTYRIGTAPFLFNAGEELEFQYVPAPALLIEGGLGYLDADIEKVSTIVGATTAVTTHSKLPYTPKLQCNVALGYSFDIGVTARARPRIEAVYTAHQYFDAGNTFEISQVDSITLLNAGVTLEGLRGGWKFALGVNNIGDKIFPIAGNSSLTSRSGYAEIAYNRGREAFASFTKEF